MDRFRHFSPTYPASGMLHIYYKTTFKFSNYMEKIGFSVAFLQQK